MGEPPVQLVHEVKQPIAVTSDHLKRVDYEDKRSGVTNVFMFAASLANERHVLS